MVRKSITQLNIFQTRIRCTLQEPCLRPLVFSYFTSGIWPCKICICIFRAPIIGCRLIYLLCPTPGNAKERYVAQPNIPFHDTLPKHTKSQTLSSCNLKLIQMNIWECYSRSLFYLPDHLKYFYQEKLLYRRLSPCIQYLPFSMDYC